MAEPDLCVSRFVEDVFLFEDVSSRDKPPLCYDKH